jgi:hypothetical protein
MTSKLYAVAMAKEKVTVYLDPEIARAMRVSAARRGMKDSHVIEEALHEDLGYGALERLSAAATLDWEAALELAVREQHANRRERTRRAS